MRKPLSSRILFEVLAKLHRGENQSSRKQSLGKLIIKYLCFWSIPSGQVAHAEWVVSCVCSQRTLLTWVVGVEEFFSKGLRKCVLERHRRVSVGAAGSSGFYFLALSPQFGKECKTLCDVKCWVPKASFCSHHCVRVLWISDYLYN